jgi:amino acid adenylation domain-containing protein
MGGETGSALDRLLHHARATAETVVVGDRTRPLQMSPLQEGFWFESQLYPESRAPNVRTVLRLTGALDRSALARALAAIAARHEVLRTLFSEKDGSLVQTIGAAPQVSLEEADMRGRPREAVAGELQAFGDALFDLRRGPLWRAKLIRRDDDHILGLAFHHLAFDGGSTPIFLRELALIYPLAAAGRDPEQELGPLPLQYADCAATQHRRIETLGEAQLAFWRERLAGASSPDLPLRAPRPAKRGTRGGRQGFRLEKASRASVHELARRLDTTPFVTTLAAFMALLCRWTGQPDQLVGLLLNARTVPGSRGLLGSFVNMVAIRTHVRPAESFERLVTRVRDDVLDAFANADVPWVHVARELQRTGHRCAPQVVFTLDPTLELSKTFGDVGYEVVPLKEAYGGKDTLEPRFDIAFRLTDRESGITGLLEYDADLFTTAAMDRFTTSFDQLLAAALSESAGRIGGFQIVSEEDRRKLVAWNDTTRDLDARFVHEMFVEQARSTPDAIAVEDATSRFTFAELEDRARRVAGWLLERGVTRGSRIGVSVGRSVEMVAAVIGALMAGACYVPIDPALPEARRTYLQEDAACASILDETTLAAAFTAKPVSAIPILGGEDAAYLLYTSGSTGRPKGVVVPHRALANFVAAMQREPGMDESDVLLAITTLSFDMACLELYLPLTTGAKLVIAESDVVSHGGRLAERIRSARATMMQATPPTWRLLLGGAWLPPWPMKLVCGGEPMTPDIVDPLVGAGAELWNGYGPTETTVYATTASIKYRITIGRPIANTRVYVLDAEKQLAPIGVVGELHIGGVGLARGYHGRSDLTAEKFVPDPYAPTSGARMYATGDLARWEADGSLECLGRTDHQVKLRGFRIELGEIESNLASLPNVREAVVTLRREPSGFEGLVAYVVTAADDIPEPAALRDQLLQILPAYMIPNVFVFLKALPRAPTGKIDRAALPSPDVAAPESSYVAPRDDIEAAVAEIMAEVLRRERVGIYDDFFALGLHSLHAMAVVGRVEVRLGVRLTMTALFDAPDVAHLALAIKEERA